MTRTDHTHPAAQQHTPGPWRACDTIIFNPKGSLMKDKTDHIGGQIANVGGLGVANDTELKANVRRIVAAINACEGISTEALEQGVVAELLEALQQVVRILRTDSLGYGDNKNILLNTCGAAIAKAEGKS